GGLVGEGHSENMAAARLAGGKDMGDAGGQDARFARARAGQDEQRAFGGFHGFALFGVQSDEIVRRARGELGRDRALRAVRGDSTHYSLTNLFLFSCQYISPMRAKVYAARHEYRWRSYEFVQRCTAARPF